MRTSTSLIIAAAAMAAALGSPSLACAQAKNAIAIADNEGLFIDGERFSIVSGSTHANGPALIRKLEARALGPGAIIFRVGNRLYIAQAPSAVAIPGYGSDRYGSDRDSGVSATQAERDYRDWQRSLGRFGSDRDSDASPTQAERDLREWQGSARRFGSDRYGSDRYGSDRYGSDRYGSDRVFNPSSAQAERDYREWQESLRAGYGRPSYGSDRYIVDDPDYALYRLKRAFEANWISAENTQTP